MNVSRSQMPMLKLRSKFSGPEVNLLLYILCHAVNLFYSSFMLHVAIKLSKKTALNTHTHRAPVVQLDEHRAATREVVSSIPAGPILKVLK